MVRIVVIAGCLLTASLVACTTEEEQSSLTVGELLEERPEGRVSVEGGIYAVGFEYFGPDEIGWDYEVELCDSLEVRPGEGADEVGCEGPSVRLPEEVVERDLDWGYADIGSLYLEGATVGGRLVGEQFQVDTVVDGDDEAGGSATASTTPSSAPVTSGTIDRPPLPIEELAGEDLYGPRTFVRGTDLVYLADAGFVDRVRQLRANCESTERLATIVGNVAGRGPELAREVVAQHDYVCPDVVARLELPDDVGTPG